MQDSTPQRRCRLCIGTGQRLFFGYFMARSFGNCTRCGGSGVEPKTDEELEQLAKDLLNTEAGAAGGGMKKRVRKGAAVSQDMRIREWPINGADVNTLFVVEPFTRDRVKLRADGFGGKPYGNGCLYCNKRDLRKPLPAPGAEGEKP